MIYLTDGSFEGILTAVFEAYAKKTEPESIVSREEFQLSLGAEIKEIETDEAKYARVYKAVIKKMGCEALKLIYGAWLSEHPDAGTAIYRYIGTGLKIGRRVISFLQNPDVLRIDDMSRRVFKEVHLFLGILRFKKLPNGIYYARIEPDNNITMLISEHFAERFADQPWIIHDAIRNIYALYNTQRVVFTRENIPIPSDSKYDREFEHLWKRYFNAIAIESRINPRLQRQYMPRRYWKNLIEKQIHE